MDNKLKQLVKEIKFRKNWFTKDVAESIGYTREHLTKEMKKGENNDIINLLLHKHAEILHGVIFDDGEKLDTEYKKDLTMQALVNLTESNRVMAESMKTKEESFKIVAATHAELVLMLKDKKTSATADGAQQTSLETTATVLGLREMMIEFVAEVTKKTPGQVQQALNKKVKAAMNKGVHKDNLAFDGKGNKE